MSSYPDELKNPDKPSEDSKADTDAHVECTFGPEFEQLRDRLLTLAPHVDVCRLIEIALTNPRLTVNEQIAIIDEIRKMSGVDRWTFRYAILGLGLVSVFAICALCYLGATGGAKELSSGILAIGSTAVGGIAGLLSQGRESKS